MSYEYWRDYQEYVGFGKNIAYDHYHKSLEFIYSFKGILRCSINRRSFILHEGQLAVVPPFASHEIDAENKAFTQINVFPPSFSDDYIAELAQRKPFYVLEDPAIASSIAEMLRDISPDTTPYMKKAIYTYARACFLENAHGHEDLEDGRPPLFYEVLNYINEHYNEDITLASLSEKFHYSKCYFSFLFNKYFQHSLKSFLNHIRIQNAINLLKDTPITQTAYAVGYSNLQSFFYNFAKITGCTPKQYTQNIEFYAGQNGNDHTPSFPARA